MKARVELRGAHITKKAKQNKEAVREWMKMNPTKTQRKCQDDLGLSHVTVIKYMREISDEIMKPILEKADKGE